MQHFLTSKEPPILGMAQFRKTLSVYVSRRDELLAKKYPFNHDLFPYKSGVDYAGCGGLWMKKRGVIRDGLLFVFA